MTRKGLIKMATMTTADLATALDTTPRTLRKFLRDDAKGVGKGSRYAIEKREVRSLAKRFAAWDEARNAKANSEGDAPEGTESD